MGLIRGFLSRRGYVHRSDVPQGDSAAFLQMLGYDMGSATQLTDRSYDTALAQCVWVFACVSNIATNVGSVPLSTYQVLKDGTREPETNNGIYDLLSYVSADDDIVSLLELTAGWLAIHGTSYWHLLRPYDNAPPVSIRCLPSNLIEVVPGKGERSATREGYRILTGSQPVLRDIDVVCIRSFGLHPYYGLSSVRPLEMVINMWSAMTRYKYNMYKHGGIPPSILKTNKPIVDEKEREKFNILWGMWRGVNNEGKPLLIGSEMELKQAGVDPDKLAGLGLSHETRETICAGFGVPPSVVGLLQDANYNTARTQSRMYWNNTIIPRYLRKIEGAANEQLVWQFEKGTTKKYYVGFDTSGVESLQEDKRERAQVASIWVKSGIKTPNEARAEEGLPPHPDGDSLAKGGSGSPSLPLDDSAKNAITDALSSPDVQSGDIMDILEATQ